MTKYIVGIIALVVVIGIGLGVSTRKKTQTALTKPTQQTLVTTGGQATVLAGTKSPYLVFTKAAYDQALADGKIVFLDFYANWCPVCRAETPVLEQGFNGLTTDKIVGFRVNFNDTETDNDEKALAKQFNVPYQHYKVIIKNGNTVLTDADSWDAQTFTDKISSVLK